MNPIAIIAAILIVFCLGFIVGTFTTFYLIFLRSGAGKE